MISYFHIDSTAKTLTATPDNGVTAGKMMSQNTSFPVQKIFQHHKNVETIKNTYVSRNNVSVMLH